MKYRIKKVKKLDEGFQINFDKVHPDANNIILAELQLKTSRVKSQGLRDALYALTNDFNSLLEITPAMIDDNPFYAVEINLKYNDDKGIGVQFIGERYLKETLGNIFVKTPFVWEDSENEKERITANLLALVNEVIYEAQEFIENEQSNQLEIFAEVV